MDLSKFKSWLKQPQGKFLWRLSVLYLGYLLIYELWLVESGEVDGLLVDHLVKGTAFLLGIFNEVAFIDGPNVGITGTSGIIIGPPCNGIPLYALFTGLIIAFPAPVRSKWLVLAIGNLGIYILNFVRLLVLALLVKYKPESFEFHHSYTFTLIIYASIFACLIFWIRKVNRR